MFGGGSDEIEEELVKLEGKGGEGVGIVMREWEVLNLVMVVELEGIEEDGGGLEKEGDKGKVGWAARVVAGQVVLPGARGQSEVGDGRGCGDEDDEGDEVVGVERGRGRYGGV